jgi:pimeloyl-ACP methyl ester carboxylesterase
MGEDQGHSHEGLSGTFGPATRPVDLGNGVVMRFAETGTGVPIVFLHGFPTSSALWRTVTERLSGDFRCIAPDLLGFGRTECPPDGDFTLGAQASQVLKLMDHLDLEEAVVVGHDWGGGVAQIMAARHPERVAGLVLVNSVGLDHEPPTIIRVLGFIARYPALFDLACETGLLRSLSAGSLGLRHGACDPASLSDAFIDHCMEPLYRDATPAYRASRERFRQALAQVVRAAPEEWREASEALRDFTRPTIVVFGCDDPFISVSTATRLADAIPGCENLELIPDTGHWVPEEQPERLATILSEHLAAPVGAT